MKNCNSYGGMPFRPSLFPGISSRMFVGEFHFPNHRWQAIAMEIEPSETAFGEALKLQESLVCVAFIAQL